MRGLLTDIFQRLFQGRPGEQRALDANRKGPNGLEGRQVCEGFALVGGKGVAIHEAAKAPLDLDGFPAGPSSTAPESIDAEALLIEQPTDCTPMPATLPSSNASWMWASSPQNGLTALPSAQGGATLSA